MKKKLFVIISVVLGAIFTLSACKSEDYTKGLVFKEYPESPGYYSVSGGGRTDYTKIRLPKSYSSWSVSNIDIDAFDSCSALSEINVPDSVVVISAGAFRGCVSLESIEIPESVKAIGAETFKASGLTSITLPAVEEIGTQSFAACTALKTVSIGGTITEVPDRAFLGCFMLQSVTLPDGITHIGRSSFESCSSLSDIDFSSGVVSVDSRAFYNCASLTRAEFTAVESIGSFSFSDCAALTDVVLPSTLTLLSDNAFFGCTALKSVTAHSTEILNHHAFDLTVEFTLRVPEELLSAYKSAEGWNEVADRIVAI